jgi:hypothetical protein
VNNPAHNHVISENVGSKRTKFNERSDLVSILSRRECREDNAVGGSEIAKQARARGIGRISGGILETGKLFVMAQPASHIRHQIAAKHGHIDGITTAKVSY